MNPRVFAFAFVCVSASLFSGCVSSYRVALTPDATTQLENSKTVGIVAIEKDEIGTSITPSKAGAGMAAFGLIGGLAGAITESAINSKASKRAEAGVTEIRNGMLEYPFGQAMNNAFAQRFAQPGGGVTLSTVVVSKNAAVPEMGRLVREADGDAVAVVFVRHVLSPDYTEAVLVTEVVICAKSEALRKVGTTKTYSDREVPVLFRNKITMIWRLAEADKPAILNKETIAAAWALNSASRLRAALDAGCAELAEIVHWDLSQPRLGNYYKESSGEVVRSTSYDNNTPTPVACKIYRIENKRVWLRATDGCIYAQPQ